MKEQLKQNLTTVSTWLRGLFMLLYAIIGSIALAITGAVILFQFVSMLLTGKPNEHLLPFAQSLSIYISQIVRYLTYNTEEKPFPSKSWPTETVANDHFTVTRTQESTSNREELQTKNEM